MNNQGAIVGFLFFFLCPCFLGFLFSFIRSEGSDRRLFAVSTILVFLMIIDAFLHMETASGG